MAKEKSEKKIAKVLSIWPSLQTVGVEISHQCHNHNHHHRQQLDAVDTEQNDDAGNDADI